METVQGLLTRRYTRLALHQVRYKKQMYRNRKPPTWASQVALDMFDQYYKRQFGTCWSSIRLALLSEPKHAALVNNFGHNPEAVCAELEMLGAVDIMDGQQALRPAWRAKRGVRGTAHVATVQQETKTVEPLWSEENVYDDDDDVQSAGNREHGQTGDVSRLVQDSSVSLPDVATNLRLFAMSDTSRFPPAKPDTDGILTYYILDAASVLPVLALNLKAGDIVLDMCAGPGGKTLAIINTSVSLSGIVANEPKSSRCKRLNQVLRLYLQRGLSVQKGVKVTSFDGCRWGKMSPNSFDKVLVDVPCTSDRHSLTHDEKTNIFHVARQRERTEMTDLQVKLLSAALAAVRPGGEVVYSTCTMSQMQNEGVVYMAMEHANQTSNILAEVADVSNLVQFFQHSFTFSEGCRIGALVLPSLPNNWGPLYFCRLRRIN
ncbi:5-methylcytosine rRNA methyltransferase NSUN4-like [Branchiostoma lanceolatum]|uniref:5-methylcytosine rRNA methyltransferase NSUN4-like n=1 Tax=Branchiostoma lanceolatum TaxID=7740 RepID=UPI003454EDE5